MKTCPICKGEKGRDDTNPETGDVRWIICAACGGVGSIDQAQLDVAPPVDPSPVQWEQESALWLGCLLTQAEEWARTWLKKGPGRFESLLISHKPPVMERLFFMADLKMGYAPEDPFRSFRIVLHRLHPLPKDGEPDYHTHDCASAVKILAGSYEHVVGSAAHREMVTTWQGEGSSWAMLDPTARHAIRPLGGPVLTLMVQDPVLYPAEYREPPEVQPIDLKPLTDNAKIRLWYDLCQALNIQYLED